MRRSLQDILKLASIPLCSTLANLHLKCGMQVFSQHLTAGITHLKWTLITPLFPKTLWFNTQPPFSKPSSLPPPFLLLTQSLLHVALSCLCLWSFMLPVELHQNAVLIWKKDNFWRKLIWIGTSSPSRKDTAQVRQWNPLEIAALPCLGYNNRA